MAEAKKVAKKAKKEVKKVEKSDKVVSYKITTADGNIIYRDSKNLNGAKMERIKAKGYKIEEI